MAVTFLYLDTLLHSLGSMEHFETFPISIMINIFGFRFCVKKYDLKKYIFYIKLQPLTIGT